MIENATDLANRALYHLGEERIASIDASSRPALVMKELWEETRNDVLTIFEWPSAMSRAVLSQLSVTNLTPYDYAYQLPENPRCLYVCSLIDVEGDTPSYEDIKSTATPWIIERRTLYCDLEDVGIRYIATETDLSLYSSMLNEAIAYKLAADAAIVLTNSNKKHERVLGAYAVWLTIAQAREVQGSKEPLTSAAAWGDTTAIADEGT